MVCHKFDEECMQPIVTDTEVCDRGKRDEDELDLLNPNIAPERRTLQLEARNLTCSNRTNRSSKLQTQCNEATEKPMTLKPKSSSLRPKLKTCHLYSRLAPGWCHLEYPDWRGIYWPNTRSDSFILEVTAILPSFSALLYLLYECREHFYYSCCYISL